MVVDSRAVAPGRDRLTETWLLRAGWKRYGRIDPQECPGPLW
jgi:hypothetical protein